MIEESDDGDYDFFDIVTEWGEWWWYFDFFDIVIEWGERCIKEGITREIISINEMLFVVLDL